MLESFDRREFFCEHFTINVFLQCELKTVLISIFLYFDVNVSHCLSQICVHAYALRSCGSVAFRQPLHKKGRWLYFFF